MAKIKIEKTIRGGYRSPSKLPLQTQRLLKILWEKHGGARHLESTTGIAAQKFIHWRNKGKVSFKSIGEVSRKLGIPIQALNFEELGDVLGKDIYQWEGLLKLEDLDLKNDELKYIIKGKAPKSYEA